MHHSLISEICGVGSSDMLMFHKLSHHHLKFSVCQKHLRILYYGCTCLVVFASRTIILRGRGTRGGGRGISLDCKAEEELLKQNGVNLLRRALNNKSPVKTLRPSNTKRKQLALSALSWVQCSINYIFESHFTMFPWSSYWYFQVSATLRFKTKYHKYAHVFATLLCP